MQPPSPLALPAHLDAWLAARFPEYPGIRICVALSGGADSMALLMGLARMRDRQPRGARPRLRAIHVDHHLHPDSGDWSRRCRKWARRAKAPIAVLHARLPAGPGRSLEADAREARYRLLREALAEGEVLVTAHHADDQLETVLLQLLRGAGVRGLAAMPEVARFGRGSLARPCLDLSRDSLGAWARSEGLDWIDDPANADPRFDRNFLRHRVLPVLRERWPSAADAATRTARHAAEAQRLLDALARADAERAADGSALLASALRTLDAERRRNAVRWWLARAGVRLPDASRLQELTGALLAARPDANPLVAWGDVRVRRHGDRLLLEPGAGTDGLPGQALCEWAWKREASVELPHGVGTLALQDDPRGPIDLERAPERVTVRLRAGGERIRPEAGGPSRSLKALMQTAKLPPAERARLPLVFDGERVLCAGDRWVDESIRALDGARRRSRLVLRRKAN